jgi:uncharacterized glyoxalase superfamily protein PhnB
MAADPLPELACLTTIVQNQIDRTTGSRARDGLHHARAAGRATPTFQSPSAMPDHVSAERLHADALSASLTVRDIHSSLAWYRDVVGFDVEREMVREGTLRGVRLRAGDVRILLNQDDGAKGLDRVKGAGFSLMLTTRQSVDAIAAHITAHGGTLVSEPEDMPWGARVFRVRDPDGYAFAISSPIV